MRCKYRKKSCGKDYIAAYHGRDRELYDSLVPVPGAWRMAMAQRAASRQLPCHAMPVD